MANKDTTPDTGKGAKAPAKKPAAKAPAKTTAKAAAKPSTKTPPKPAVKSTAPKVEAPKDGGGSVAPQREKAAHGGPGHNVNPDRLNDNQLRALMVRHTNDAAQIDAEIAVLQAKRKKVVGAAKADGITAKAMKLFEQIKAMDDAEIEELQRQLLTYARWNGRQVQASLLDWLEAAPEADSAAYSEGFMAGVKGAPAKFDHLVGQSHQAALQGHADGGKSLADAVANAKARDAQEPDPFKSRPMGDNVVSLNAGPKRDRAEGKADTAPKSDPTEGMGKETLADGTPVLTEDFIEGAEGASPRVMAPRRPRKSTRRRRPSKPTTPRRADRELSRRRPIKPGPRLGRVRWPRGGGGGRLWVPAPSDAGLQEPGGGL